MPEIGPAFLPGTVMPVYEAPMIRCAVVASFCLVMLSACGSPAADTSALREYNGGGSGSAPFPTHPDLSVTPGAVCKMADELRYPEQIKYCSRDVGSDLKRTIIAQYDRDFGYRIQAMSRGDFKIDHFIPLCMGGANERANLWPQHRSVYVKTDGIEMKLCLLLSFGSIKQVDAIDKIKHVKFNLNEAAALESTLDEQISQHRR